MQKMIKIDPHVHSNGISLCSHVDCRTIIEEKRKLGYDGVVLTNHCQSWYYPAEEHAQYIERVIEEFHRGKAYADERGFRFYLGLEVTVTEPHYSDWLLYGVTEEFLRATPCLYQLSQKQLFSLCEENGILLVQAHPFRPGIFLGDPAYMHGVEINCTPGDLERAELVEGFAAEHGLLVTCGTDYHSVDRTYFGGILIPACCQTAKEIAEYLFKEKRVTVFREGETTEYASRVFVKK